MAERRVRWFDPYHAALDVMAARGSFGCAVTVLICTDGEVVTDVDPLGPPDALVVLTGAAGGVGTRSLPARALTVSV